MTIDASFWVTISFFIFLGILIYFKIPQKIKKNLEQNILNIKNQINEAEKLKEDAKNILTEQEKKISNSELRNIKLVRKSIFAKKYIQKGELFSNDNLYGDSFLFKTTKSG